MASSDTLMFSNTTTVPVNHTQRRYERAQVHLPSLASENGEGRERIRSTQPTTPDRVVYEALSLIILIGAHVDAQRGGARLNMSRNTSTQIEGAQL